jgi:penicillin amidase/acyl-homoserine-lactone acylase
MRVSHWIAVAIALVLIILSIVAHSFGVRVMFNAGRSFDPEAAIERASAYDVEIIRDSWGIPRIMGERDVDTAFGIAYAHSEDDFLTLQTSLRASLGLEMLAKDESEARTAYLVQLLRLRQDVEAQYDTALSPVVQDMLEAYADGVNLYAAHNPHLAEPDLFPVTGHDVAVLSAFFSPLFYGLGGTLAELAAPDRESDPSRGQELQVMLQEGPNTELGSNAFAVAPSKSNDGWTRGIINSHQPVEGALAWYETHLISQEGLNIAGGTFPGTPGIHVGVNPGLLQAATVNYPDLIDVYELALEGDGYQLDGEIAAFDTQMVTMTVHLWGPLFFEVERTARWSAHGPVLDTPTGSFAVRYATLGDIRFIEQNYHMMRARNLDAFEAALELGAIGNTNRIVATADGEIARYYVARMPLRVERDGLDWEDILPGDDSSLIWSEFAPIMELPHMINPEAGYVLEANHSPFRVTEGPDDPLENDYPESYGIETHMTNRSLRAVALMGALEQISRESLLAVKYDNIYSVDGFAGTMAARISEMEVSDNMVAAQTIVSNWDRSTELDNPNAALSVMTALSLYSDNSDINAHSDGDILEELEVFADLLMTHHGQLDPIWSEVNLLHRGERSIALAGGPDTLRAANSIIDTESGQLNVVSGDGLHMLAEWAPGAEYPEVYAVHQFGASQDPASPHFDDQMTLFAEEGLRPVPMHPDAVRAQAVRIYHPLEAGDG